MLCEESSRILIDEFEFSQNSFAVLGGTPLSIAIDHYNVHHSHRQKTEKQKGRPMKVTSLVTFAVLPFAFVLLAGCTDGGAIAFRKDSSTEMDASLSESLVMQEPNARVAQESNARETESPERTETLVRTASARMPHQPSLVTLAPGDDLMAKVNGARGPVLLDFYADWCGPCKVQGKILHEMEQEAARHGTLMIKINIDDHPQIARQLQVEGIPTLMMVKEGQVVNRQSGVADKRKLAQWMQ